MPEDSWRRAPEPTNGHPQPPTLSVLDQPTLAEHEPQPARPRPRPNSRVVLAALLLAGVIVAVVLALTGGGSSSSPQKASSPSAQPSAPGAAGKSAPLVSLGRAARGTATLDGRRLTLKVS